MALAAFVGAFGALYDVAMMLYFYSTEGMWTHFTAFDIPQPIWTHSGYVVLYAAPAIYIAHLIARGTISRSKLFVLAGVTLLESARSRSSVSTAASTVTGGRMYSGFRVPVGDWRAGSRSGDLLRGGGIAVACPVRRSVATAGSVRPVSVHILRGQLRRRLAHNHRDSSRGHLDGIGRGGNGGEHWLRGSACAGCCGVPAAAIGRAVPRIIRTPRSEAQPVSGMAVIVEEVSKEPIDVRHPHTPIFATPSYILAGAMALVLTWPHAIQWMADGGNILNPVEFFGDAIAGGGTAAFLSIDMAIAWLVFMVWVVFDSKRIGLGYKWGWLFVALSYIGVSMAFPVYLVTRERYLDKCARTDELSTHQT